jgi:hypothetical protein
MVFIYIGLMFNKGVLNNKKRVWTEVAEDIGNVLRKQIF